MGDIIDLHVHSYISDGTFSPDEIINMAYKKGIKAIALTDHDSIEGNYEAEKEASRFKIDFLRGIEISCIYNKKRLLHIIGLGIDTTNSTFLDLYNKVKKAREESVSKILLILQERQINIDINILKKRCLKKNLDRYDIYRYFMEEGLCSNAQEVWDKYLDPIPYESSELIGAEEAIKIINKAGGISILAHYCKKIGFQGCTKSDTEFFIKDLVNSGLNGMELYYPSYTRQDIDTADYLIKKYNLIVSGGTDFHGENRPNIALGTGDNNLAIPYSVYTNIINQL